MKKEVKNFLKLAILASVVGYYAITQAIITFGAMNVMIGGMTTALIIALAAMAVRPQRRTY